MNGKIAAYILVALIVGIAVGYGIFKATSPHQATGEGQTSTTETITQGYTTTYQQSQTTTNPQVTQEEYTIKLAYSPELGFYLTDKNGMTLYFFAKDYDGKSHCSGDCAQKWPVFYTDTIKPSPGLDVNDFGVIVRDDGTKQVTYKGWPLYYFFQDNNPGDINGEGKKGVWFVAKPDYTVMIAVKPDLGSYLVTPDGMTLYFFANDQPNNSTCYGMCAQNWPPYSPEASQLGDTVNSEYNRLPVHREN